MTFQPEAGGPLDKFRLLYAVATDGRASRSHVAVMAVILWRYNKAHGCCWPSVESIAEDASTDERTARRAIDSLEDWGYMHAVRQRGKLNRYVPHFQAQREPASKGTSARGSDQKGGHSRPEGRAPTPQREDIYVHKGRAPTPPEYLNEPIQEKEKEKGNGFFPSDWESGKKAVTKKRSPGRHAVTSKALWDSRFSLGMLDGKVDDYANAMVEIEDRYRAQCATDGIEVDETVIAKLRSGPGEPEFPPPEDPA